VAKLRYAVVGAGGIGHRHAEVASKLEEYELVAIADVVEERARELASKFNAKAYTNYIEMLEKEQLDVISVCTPHPTHAEIAIEAMKRGVNVLTEKPMAATVSQCLAMIREARKRGVKLGVVFQNRFESRIRKARKIVEAGELGDIYRALLRYVTYRDMAYFMSAAWRGKWATEGGGVLINQAVHYIDLFLWLLGKRPREVFAYAATAGHDIEVEDLVSAVAVFEGGCQGVMQFSTLDRPDMTNIELRGDKAMLLVETSPKRADQELRNETSVYIYRNTPPVRRAIYASIKPGASRITYTIEEVKPEEIFAGHAAVLYDFARAVLEDREPEVPGEEGIKSVELINAIIMSAVEHRPVEIPFDPARYDELLKRLEKLGSPPWPTIR
jgi:predicted dehydrogenase